MMASIPAYNEYTQKVLMPAMDQGVLAEIQNMEAEHRTVDPRYMELLMEHHYTHHILRMPQGKWPDGVLRALAHVNPAVYVPMQGPSELGASGNLEHWDRSGELGKIEVPTLVIGAKYNTMDPVYMETMSTWFPKGRYLYCPEGSHLAMYNDQRTFMDGVIGFLRELDPGVDF